MSAAETERARTAPVPATTVAIGRLGPVAVCTIAGNLDRDSLPEAEALLDAMARSQPVLLCVDMRQVGRCARDAAALLVRMSRRLPCAVISPSPAVRDMIHSTGHGRTLRVFDTITQATAALRRTDPGAFARISHST